MTETDSFQKELLSLLDDQHQGLLCISPEGDILSVNSYAEKFFGLTSKELIGYKYTDVSCSILKEDGSIFPNEEHPFSIALQTGKAVSNIDTRFISHDRNQQWIRLTISPEYKPEQDIPYCYSVNLLDITEQKRTQKKLENRTKEIEAIFTFAKILDLYESSLDEVCQHVIDFLPQSWQYSNIASGKLKIYDKEFYSPNYQPSSWTQTSPIDLLGTNLGYIEINYWEERPEGDEGPFLKEEKELLATIAQRIARLAERRNIYLTLEKKNELLELTLQAAKLGRFKQNSLDSGIILDETARSHFCVNKSVVNPDDILNRIAPEDQQRILAEMQNATEKYQKGPISTEFRIIQTDGTIKWLAVNGKITYSETENGFIPVSPVGTTQDITYRKQKDIDLQLTNEKYRLISENSQDMIWVMDVETQHFTYCSPAIEKVRGFTPEECLQQSLKDVLTPESYEKSQSILEQVLKFVQDGVDVTLLPIELQQYRKDGSIITTETSASLVIDSNGKIQVIGISRDVTERKNSEEALRVSYETTQAIFDATVEAVYLVDKEGIILASNQSGAQAFNVSSSSEIIGKNIIQFFPAELHDLRYSQLNRILEERTPRFLEEELGGDIYQLNVYPILDPEGSVERLAIYAKNITEAKSASLERQQFYEDLEFINKLNNAIIEGENWGQISILMKEYFGKVFDSSGLALFLVSEDRENLQIVNFSLPEIIEKEIIQKNITPTHFPEFHMDEMCFYRKILSQREANIATDLQNMMKRFLKIGKEYYGPTYFEKFETTLNQTLRQILGNKSLIALPLYSGEKPVGIFEILSGQAFSTKEIKRLQTISGQITTAILHRKMEEDLRESNKRFTLLADNIPEAFWVKTQPQGNVIYMSPAFETIWERNQNEFILSKEKIKETIHPKDRLLSQQVQKDESNGIPIDLEYRIVRPNGKIRWISERSFPVFDEEGKLLHTSGISIDITDKKLADLEQQQFYKDLEIINELNNSIIRGDSLHQIAERMNEKFTQAFSASSLSLFLLNDEQNQLIPSSYTLPENFEEELVKLFGKPYPIEQILNKPDSIYKKILYGKKGKITSNPKEIRKRFSDIVEAYNSSFKSEMSLEKLVAKLQKFFDINSIISLPLSSGDQVYGLLEMSSHEILSEKELIRLETIGGQITGAILRRKTESNLMISNERFHQLADNIPEVFWIKDQLTDKVTYFSKAFETVWGRDPKEYIEDPNKIIETYHPDDVAMILKAQTDESTGRIVEYEYRILRPEGNIHWIRERSFPIFNDEGKLIRTSGISSDITESKIAEMELKESESFLRSILQSSPGDIFTVDLEGFFLYTNKPWPGQTKRDFQKKKFFNGIHPTQIEHAKDLFNKTIQLKSIQQAEFKRIGIDGDYRWNLIVLSPIIVDGQVKRVVVFAFDIHERKEAEAALHKNEETRKALLEAIRESVFLLNSDGTGVLCNTTALERLHITEKQFIGHDFFELIPIHVAKNRKHQLANVVQSKQTIQFEDERNGINFLNIISPVIDDDGLVRQVAYYAIDVTELKKKEEQVRRLSHVVEQTVDTVIITNVEGKIEYINPAFEKLTGYSTSEVIGENFNFLKAGTKSQKLNEIVIETIHKDNVYTGEFTTRKKNGELFTEIKSITPMKNEIGEIINFVEVGKDITEKKLAEEKLRLSEHRNKAIVDAIPDLLFRIKSDGTFVDFHAKSMKDLLSPPETFIGKKIEDVLPPEVTEPSMKAIRKAFKENRLQYFQYNLKTDNVSMYFEGRVVANIAEDEAIAFIRDVTEQKQTDLKLRKSEEKYRQLSIELEKRVEQRTAELQDLYDNAPTGYHSLDINGYFIRINETELRWLGYKSEEIIGKKRFADIVTPESAQRFEENFIEFKNIGYGNNIEHDFVRKDGSIFPVLMKSTAIYDSNGVYQFSRSTVFDNTDRKAIEAEIHRINELSETAFELSKAGYWYDPRDGTDYYYPSERVTEIHGDEYRSDHRYHIVNDWLYNISLADPDIASLVSAGVHSFHAGKSERFDAEYPYKRPKDGKIIWLHTVGNPIRDQKGNMVAVSGVTQDITQQKELEMEKIKAKDAAEAANNAKSAFLANMSHEIRTPMNAILGFAQIMRNDPKLNEKNRNYLEIINRSGEHLLALINEVLEMSKIESGHVKLNPVTFHLPSLIKDVESMFQPRLKSKNLSISLHLSPDLPTYINTDENKLKEILINLIGNAIKFTNTGEITLRCYSDYDPNSVDHRKIFLYIDVEDTGMGILPEDMPKLFEAFEQTQNGVNLSGSTGLGLAISRNHARLLGGDITVTSTPGAGSCFHVKILATQSENPDVSSKLPNRKVIGLLPNLKIFKVLIVDDNEENRLVVNELLKSIGILTHEAFDGEKAVEITRTWQPDLILMDLRMPNVDGFEAAKRIREFDKENKIPIIAFTSTAFELDEQKLMESGINGFLRKPFKDYELFSLLETKLGPIFLYDDQIKKKILETESTDKALTPEDILSLPMSLIKQMESATINARQDVLINLIDKIRLDSPIIANKLHDLAINYQYDALLKLFQEG